jgi:hypothetical protein
MNSLSVLRSNMMKKTVDRATTFFYKLKLSKYSLQKDLELVMEPVIGIYDSDLSPHTASGYIIQK